MVIFGKTMSACQKPAWRAKCKYRTEGIHRLTQMNTDSSQKIFVQSVFICVNLWIKPFLPSSVFRVFRSSSSSTNQTSPSHRKRWNPFRVRSLRGIVTQGSPKAGNPGLRNETLSAFKICELIRGSDPLGARVEMLYPLSLEREL